MQINFLDLQKNKIMGQDKSQLQTLEKKEKSIKIIFQKTKDKRVYNFLINQGFDVQELELNTRVILSENLKITCIILRSFLKYFYDSLSSFEYSY